MRYPLALLLAIGITSLAQSQVLGKFYYNKYWELTTKDSVVYVRMCVYDTANGTFAGPVTDMFKSGKPQMKGTYAKGQKAGEFTFFYENGQVESKGRFEANERIGIWKYYYPNGQEKMVVEYSNPTGVPVLFVGGLSKTVQSLKDSNGVDLVKNGAGKFFEEFEEYRVPGKVTVTGRLFNFEKNGSWEATLSDGTKLYTEKYTRGMMTSGVIYADGKKSIKYNIPHESLELPYKLRVTESFVAARGIDFNVYPFLRSIQPEGEYKWNDKLYPKPEAIVSPDARCLNMMDFYRAIGDEMDYPPEARRMGVQGEVFVEIRIENNGSVQHVNAISGPDESLKAEAVRSVKKALSTYIFPAGNCRNGSMVLPITFKLG